MVTKKTAFCARNLFDFEKLKFDSVELEFDSKRRSLTLWNECLTR